MNLNIRRLNFNHKYFICDKGFVISTAKGLSILKPRVDKFGYNRCYIRDMNDNKRKDYKIHRLVAEYFIENPDNLQVVNHIDGNKQNNYVNNLEWCTHSDNNYHAYKTGLSHSRKCPVLCTTNNTIYPSQAEASAALNISRKCIIQILKGEAYSFKGLHFEYADENWNG